MYGDKVVTIFIYTVLTIFFQNMIYDKLFNLQLHKLTKAEDNSSDHIEYTNAWISNNGLLKFRLLFLSFIL
jgi:hypothetical protein